MITIITTHSFDISMEKVTEMQETIEGNRKIWIMYLASQRFMLWSFIWMSLFTFRLGFYAAAWLISGEKIDVEQEGGGEKQTSWFVTV